MKRPRGPEAALLLLAFLIAAAPTLACGGSRRGGADGGNGGGGGGGVGQAGRGGSSGTSGGGGGVAGRGGNGGGGTGGVAGNGGDGGTGGAAGTGGQAGVGGGAGQAGAAGGTGGTGGAAGAGGQAGAGGGGGVVVDGGVDAVVFDGGSDCVAPVGEAPLDAAAAGIPTGGLVLWLRGDRGIHKTAANAVCAWADQSGHGAIFTPYSGRPSWSATGIAGRPAVRSNTAGSGLSTSGVLGIAPTSPRTLIAVVQLVSTTARFSAVFQGRSGTPGTYLGLDTNTFNTAGSREGVYMHNNAYDSALATSLSPRIHVYTISNMTVGTPVLSGIAYHVDGAAQTLTRNPGGLGNGNFEDFSAADYTSVVTTAEGLVAEVLVYDRALNVTERTAVEAALRTRYAIP